MCSPCRKKPSDCLYDAESDQRRTTALKARIQDLNKETEDLKDIVKGIATAPNRDAALAAARTLAATGFRQTANVADAFRKEQAAEDEASKQQERTVAEPMACTPLWTGSASILYSPWSHGATTDAAIHNSPGRMSLEPWSLQAQAELLQFAQSGLDNDPAEVSILVDRQTFPAGLDKTRRQFPGRPKAPRKLCFPHSSKAMREAPC